MKKRFSDMKKSNSWYQENKVFLCQEFESLLSKKILLISEILSSFFYIRNWFNRVSWSQKWCFDIKDIKNYFLISRIFLYQELELLISIILFFYIRKYLMNIKTAPIDFGIFMQPGQSGHCTIRTLYHPIPVSRALGFGSIKDFLFIKFLI